MDPANSPTARLLPPDQLRDLSVPDAHAEAGLARPKQQPTEPFARQCAWPDRFDPLTNFDWHLRYSEDPVSTGVALLGEFCQMISREASGQSALSTHLRELIVLGIIHRVRSDAAFRQQLSEWVEVAPAFDELNLTGELDPDSDAAGVNRWSDEEFARNVLTMFSLQAVVAELRAGDLLDDGMPVGNEP